MSSRPPSFINSANAECSCPFAVVAACLAIVETGIPPAVAAEGFYRRPFLHGHQLRYLNLQIFTDMFLFYMLISDSFKNCLHFLFFFSSFVSSVDAECPPRTFVSSVDAECPPRTFCQFGWRRISSRPPSCQFGWRRRNPVLRFPS